jgi:hypothetical protein
MHIAQQGFINSTFQWFPSQESLPQFSSRKNLFVKLPLTWREEEGGGRVMNTEEGRIGKMKEDREWRGRVRNVM